MTKKTSAQLDREVAAVTGLRDGWTKARVREGWPETWDKHIRSWWYTVEARPGGGWYAGFSHQRGNADAIDRGGWFKTWEAATKWAEEHAGATRWER